MNDGTIPHRSGHDYHGPQGGPEAVSGRTFRDLPRLRAFAVLVALIAAALVVAVAVAILAGGRTGAHRGLGWGPRIVIIATGVVALAGLIWLVRRVSQTRLVIDANMVSIHNFFATVAIPTGDVTHFSRGRSSGFLISATAVCTDGRRISVDAVARPSGPGLTDVLAQLDEALVGA